MRHHWVMSENTVMVGSMPKFEFYCTRCGKRGYGYSPDSKQFDTEECGGEEEAKRELHKMGVDGIAHPSPHVSKDGDSCESNFVLIDGGNDEPLWVESKTVRTKTDDEIIESWDKRSVVDLLEAYENGELYRRCDVDTDIQIELGEYMPVCADNYLVKPGDRVAVYEDDEWIRGECVAVGPKLVYVLEDGATIDYHNPADCWHEEYVEIRELVAKAFRAGVSSASGEASDSLEDIVAEIYAMVAD